MRSPVDVLQPRCFVLLEHRGVCSFGNFKLAETQVRDNIRAWYGNRWFAPNSLKSAALTDTLKGVYLPYWTFDAHAHAEWTAESGYHYTESETYRERVWDWFNDDIYTRLDPKASIILIQTRWHEDDLAGRRDGGRNRTVDQHRLP